MRKLLKSFDNSILRFWVAFLLIFIPLYPKLPAIGITHTWVYIRVEDFLILTAVLIFLVQFVRKKARIHLPTEIPIILYWIAGFASLAFSLAFIAPHLANFFPNVAILSYIRRIEYMILFFVALSTIKSEKDVKFYFWVLVTAAIGYTVYGFGQRYYIDLWAQFPKFFEKFPFCFPSFQTTNEEFAKGIPLCLPKEGRITSLFGGHYDLSAYLVFVIPIFFAVAVSFKNLFNKIGFFISGLLLVTLLILTESRVSFIAYIIGITATFLFLKKKKMAVVILVVSFFLLFTFSSSTLHRFADTFRFVSVVINPEGQVVGETVGELPEDLKKKLAHDKVLLNAPPPTQELPTGSSYLTFGSSVATSSALLKNAKNLTAAQRKQYQFGAIEISSVSGQFSIQRAVVYDISFTTRFQAEWPTAWHSFVSNPLTGSGFASITLATDNDFLRLLGESGALGFLSYVGIFVIWGIFVRHTQGEANKFTRLFVLGTAGGVIGLFVNAIMIDVFEASKVAESMWMIMGIATGGLMLTANKKVDYFGEIKRMLSTKFATVVYLAGLSFVFFAYAFDNFFVADDFVWLKWAATSSFSQVLTSFTRAGDFFYRPIDKIVTYFMYAFLTFEPAGYHLLAVIINLTIAIVIFFVLHNLFKKKSVAFLGAAIFAFNLSNVQDIYWISAISNNISTLFIVAGLIFYYLFKTKGAIWYILGSLVFGALALFSYEGAAIYVLLLPVIDIFIGQKLLNKKTLFSYIPFVAITLIYFYFRTNAKSAGFSGDYNYNLVKFIPNAIGNFAGYIMLFLFGDASVPAYNAVRGSLRAYYVPVAIISLAVAFFVGFILLRIKDIGRKATDYKIELLSFLFAFICLLPFLGLGNIAERYDYPAAIGFSILLISLINRFVFTKIKDKKRYLIIFSVFTFIILGYLYAGQRKAENEWDATSKITYKALASFKLNYDVIPHYSNIYLVNVPTRYANAYIFPVGLPESLWFVYRDPTLKIYQVKTIDEAKALKAQAEATTLVKNRIFEFDKNFDFHEVIE